jgi:heat shock protein HslJ
MIGYNDISIGAIVGIQSADLSLTLTRDRYSARICNQLNGSYRANAGNIETSYAMSTKMACPDGLLSKMEAAWNLEGATYRIASARQMA